MANFGKPEATHGIFLWDNSYQFILLHLRVIDKLQILPIFEFNILQWRHLVA